MNAEITVLFQVFKQKEIQKDGLVEIMDVNSILLKQLNINRIQDQATVNILDWKPGIYIASLKLDEKTTESVKFTLVK